ncbi:MAG: SRPBCC family protein [Acidobacteria bacterium]|nr:SRPBCC family protein [Acidobacteriota bacterium]
MLKKVILFIAVVALLIGFGLIAAVFVAPTGFAVEREIVINKPREEVFAYARMLKNQNEWGPWFKKEPTMKQEFRGTDGEAGFVSSWKAETQGVGEQEIMKIVENERIETQLRFSEPFESKANTHMTFESVGEGQTRVKWGMSGDAPRPMNVMLLFLNVNNAIGKDYDEGLANLKQILESK